MLLCIELTIAAAAIRRTTWLIKSGDEAAKIKGIGEGFKTRVSGILVVGVGVRTERQIDEFLQGRPGRLFYDMDEQMQATQAFAKIYGVGTSAAQAGLTSRQEPGLRPVSERRSDHCRPRCSLKPVQPQRRPTDWYPALRRSQYPHPPRRRQVDTRPRPSRSDPN